MPDLTGWWPIQQVFQAEPDETWFAYMPAAEARELELLIEQVFTLSQRIQEICDDAEARQEDAGDVLEQDESPECPECGSANVYEEHTDVGAGVQHYCCEDCASDFALDIID